jgi:TolA-binding protein
MGDQTLTYKQIKAKNEFLEEQFFEQLFRKAGLDDEIDEIVAVERQIKEEKLEVSQLQEQIRHLHAEIAKLEEQMMDDERAALNTIHKLEQVSRSTPKDRKTGFKPKSIEQFKAYAREDLQALDDADDPLDAAALEGEEN